MAQAVQGTAPLIPNAHRPPPPDYMSATNPLHPGAQSRQPPSDYISATDPSMQQQQFEQKSHQPPSDYLSATDPSMQQQEFQQQMPGQGEERQPVAAEQEEPTPEEIAGYTLKIREAYTRHMNRFPPGVGRSEYERRVLARAKKMRDMFGPEGAAEVAKLPPEQQQRLMGEDVIKRERDEEERRLREDLDITDQDEINRRMNQWMRMKDNLDPEEDLGGEGRGPASIGTGRQGGAGGCGGGWRLPRRHLSNSSRRSRR